MASAFAHAVVAGSAYLAMKKDYFTGKVMALGIFAAVMPDLDVIGHSFGIRYGDMMGHRGFSHSILFAIGFSALLVLIFHRKNKISERYYLLAFYFLCTVSHGMIDAMTTGGKGIGFFIPFSEERYFLPWRFIKVSSMRWQRFFSSHGVRVLQNELFTVMLPALVTGILIHFGRRIKSSK